ncbi:MAG: gliding motility lipoprotein GldH [Prevotella sp.]|jgi:gliding motility-associated lipoprotein GldH|nr:gliding motility lipoprotein GldH [Prevotella sp.]
MKRTNHLIGLLLVITVALLTSSCNRKMIFHHYEHTPVSGWEREYTLHFYVPPVSQRAVVQRHIELRTSGSYPYRNLCIVVEQTTFPSHYFLRDTLRCDLVNAKDNNGGKGISLYQYSFPLPDISVNEGDSMHFCIRHLMRSEELPGITDIGVSLTSY